MMGPGRLCSQVAKQFKSFWQVVQTSLCLNVTVCRVGIMITAHQRGLGSHADTWKVPGSGPGKQQTPSHPELCTMRNQERPGSSSGVPAPFPK